MVVRLPEMKKYLNRDGLEEYNSLLPHSSTEIEEYVADWLDAHPEATTTVQDGSISTQKLADASVTRNKLAADVAHLLGGMMLAKDMQGEILSASDAYSVAPLSMTVDGKSTQNGTPTPDSPVSINSIEVLNFPITFAGKNLFDKVRIGNHSNWNTSRTYAYIAIAVPPNTPITAHYNHAPFGISNCYLHMSSAYGVPAPSTQYLIANSATNARNTVHATSTADGNIYLNMYGKSAETLQTIMNTIGDILQIEVGDTASEYVPFTVASIVANIPMQGHVLRSLPDGTHDTMLLSYLRESDRAGLAWYSRELVQNVGLKTFDGSEDWRGNSAWYGFYASYQISAANSVPSSAILNTRGVGSAYSKAGMESALGATGLSGTIISYNWDNAAGVNRVSAFKAWLANNNMTVHYPLATPITTQLDPVELPVLPAPNCTVWSDPTTGLKMSYMRDTNIVISDLEQAMADI